MSTAMFDASVGTAVVTLSAVGAALGHLVGLMEGSAVGTTVAKQLVGLVKSMA
jgi:hypothetical protein